MHRKLFFIRKIKALFIKFKLHLLIKPFYGLMFNTFYLAKLSEWCNVNRKLSFNDFYNNKVNYNDRFKLHNYVFNKEELNDQINYIEFGVAEGTSFKWWLGNNKNPHSKFYGFDTFTGLPEDFGVMKKSDYNTMGIFPDVKDDRACFIPGMFQDSLPKFIDNIDFSKRSVFHMDADLYSSTLFVLTYLFPRMKKNDIIIFDEFGVPTHEFRTFLDFTHAYLLFKYEIIGAINNYLQLALKVK